MRSLRIAVLAAVGAVCVAGTAAHGQIVNTLHKLNFLDGARPTAKLVQGIDSNFYGAAQQGGTFNDGTVFKITSSGSLTVLYNFNHFNGSDGRGPYAGLVLGIDSNFFYGVTEFGGSNDFGTVFKITSAGSLTTLYQFSGPDGAHPTGVLVQNIDSNFYGTTLVGGTNDMGTVFEITPTGSLTTLYQFSGTDGAFPIAGLALGKDGFFYGTTTGGGTNDNGTVFKISSAGSLTTLWQFDGADGYDPNATLVQGNDGYFYGTTQFATTPSFTQTGVQVNEAPPGFFGTVFQLVLPQSCSITGNLAICPGQTTTLTAAPFMISYLWDGPEQKGATNEAITVGTAGTYSVTQVDSNGLTNACSAVVTNIAGLTTIICPSNITVQCTSQVPAPNTSSVTATNNCGPVPVTWGGDSSATFFGVCSRYTFKRTFFAVDSSGTTNTCQQTITVNNTTAPTITVFPSNVTVQCASQVPAANDASVSATGYCGPFAFISHDPDSISGQTCSNRYTITRTYHASDGCGNSVSSNQTITVNDTTPPTITCPAPVTTNSDPGQCYASGVVLGNPTAFDNCYGTVTLTNNAPAQFPKGTNAVIWTATDNCGNSATCTQSVVVVGGQSLAINCPYNIISNTAPGTCGSTITFSTPTAVNNCGTVNVWCSPSSGTLFAQGTTKVTCTANDGQGHTTNCSFNVTVNQPAVCGITVSGNSGNSTTICQGNTVILTAPNGMKHYLWSGPEQNGAMVQTIVVGTPGTYCCTEAQYYGPTNCCCVTITVNPPPACNITGNLLITNGLPTTLVGPDGMKSQYWTGPQNNGLASRTNIVSLAGTYTLHLTDSNGCQSACPVTVTNRTPQACSIRVSGDAGGLTICQGRKTTLTAENGMVSYLWSGPEQNGATTQFIVVGTQGTYCVRQIDHLGLTNNCCVSVVVNPLPYVKIYGSRIICQGSTTTLCGPSGMKGYLWLGPQHNGLNTQCNTLSIGGSYTLVITDSNGCQNAQTVPVSVIYCPPDDI